MSRPIFIQGLRRSSTTFLYDILLADPRFDGYYEPLAAAQKQAIGGGSRMSDVDFFEKIRDVRRRYCESIGSSEIELLNHGAPRDPKVELERELPKLVEGYVRFMTEQSEWTVLKFVRAWRKLAFLGARFPNAKILHIVRDPRAVVTSFLFGKGQKNAARFKSPEDFFGLADNAKGNQGIQVANELIARGELRLPESATNAEKLLGLWQVHFRSSHDDGTQKLGPKQYLLVRHEDFLERAGETVERIYAFLGDAVPDSVREFLRAKLDPRQRIYEPNDPRWQRMIESVGCQRELREAGYDFAQHGSAREVER